ncbi:DUF4214 domain-containing protein, partial [Escherichia coli]|nr:DUF4214 domain-containing protein [Escherichia coli]
SAAGFEHAYPSNPVPSGSQIIDPVGFANSIKSADVINYLYPNASASEKVALASSISNGSLSVTDFASAISILKPSSNPTVDQIKATPDVLTGAANLPSAGLHFDGISKAQLDFVTSMYIGAFGRTPEYEGLKYWTSELATDLSHGMTQSAAFLAVGQNIYKAGSENGESGTTLNNADYVNFAYNNALGRAPDQAGYDYWVNDLNSGNMSRGNYLTTFLTAGMNSERDSNFLVGRIAVGEFAAQQHVSGNGAPGIDSKAILATVTDIASANTVISGIISHYGVAPSTASIELTGVSTLDVHA